MVRRLVELHGGTVVAHSDGSGAGSSFEVRLPRSKGHLAPEVAPLFVERSASLRIVLVEDHADTRESLRALLEQEGHHVSVAEDGPTGFERILAERPDLAIIDIGMPGFDGLELARRMRAAHFDPAPTLVALTGYGGSDNRTQALAAGFDHYFVKPFDIAAFRAWLAMDRVAPPPPAVITDDDR